MRVTANYSTEIRCVYCATSDTDREMEYMIVIIII